MTIYEALRDAGCKLDHHESDLYVKEDFVSIKILNNFVKKGSSRFWNEVDGQFWFDIPFAYDPFWAKRLKNLRRLLKNEYDEDSY